MCKKIKKDFKDLKNKLKKIKINTFLMIISLILSLILLWLINNYNKEISWFFKISIPIFSTIIIYIILFNVLFNKKDERYVVVLTAFMVLILILQLVVMVNQTRISGLQVGISDKQTEIIEKTSLSNWADVEVKFLGEIYPVPAERLSNLSIEKYNLPIFLINSGKVNSGQIGINPSSDEFIYARLEPRNDVRLESQKGNFTHITISQRGCYKDNFGCDPSKLPEGLYNLTLKFTCWFCHEENFKESIFLNISHESK